MCWVEQIINAKALYAPPSIYIYLPHAKFKQAKTEDDNGKRTDETRFFCFFDFCQ